MRGRARHAEIAGAGFVGLTAAAALCQRGWTVRVHEKGPELRQFGAGIYVWENSLRVLEQTGAAADVLANSASPPFYETRFQHKTVSKETFGPIRLRALTRQNLYAAILGAAQRAGAEIVTNSEVVSADRNGSIRLASGKVLRADLVIGADGVGSNVRESLAFKQRREKSRDGITRLLVPRMKAELGPGEWDNVIDFWNLEPRVLRVLYSPCDDNNLYLALMAPREDKEGSRTPIDRDLWVENFPELRPVLEEAAKVMGRYDGYETTYVEEWTTGKVVLVGDAAHAMCPALAQGAGCGIMNAYSLAECVSESDDVEGAIKEWERRERPVTDRCQERSAYFAATRSMSKGNQFSPTMLETATYDVTGRGAAQLVVGANNKPMSVAKIEGRIR
jgi:2-methyl-3-hydroxypyridine 5-carboxylic acid dioxygenase